MRVVDLTTLYHFQKGYMGFFFTDLQYTVAIFECQPVFLNSRAAFGTCFSSFSTQN
jgi:hypothetical protein